MPQQDIDSNTEVCCNAYIKHGTFQYIGDIKMYKSEDMKVSVEAVKNELSNKLRKALVSHYGADDPLSCAACSGDANTVARLLQQNKAIDINRLNARGLAPLHVAAATGHEEIVQMLLTAGAELNIQSTSESERGTPLARAIEGVCVDVVGILLKANASLKLKPNLPLSNTVLQLARECADDSEKNPSDFIRGSIPDRRKIVTLVAEHVLTTAAAGNIEAQLILGYDYLSTESIEAIKWFTRAKEQGNLEAKYKLGTMMIGSQCGFQNRVEDGLRLVQELAAAGYKEAQDFFRDYNAFLQNYFAQQRAIVLTQQDDKKVEQEIVTTKLSEEDWLTDLVCKDDANAIYEAHNRGLCLDTPFGNTLVSIAAERGCTKVIAALKAAGADLNSEGVNGTPLHVAINNGQEDTIKALITAGAIVDDLCFFSAILTKDVRFVIALLEAKTLKIGRDDGVLSKAVLKGARTDGNGDIIRCLEAHLLKAANEGNIEAQLMVAEDYLNDKEGKNDVEARRLFRCAAEKGNLEAKYWFGCMIFGGRGGNKDYVEGYQLIKEAAEAGYPAALSFQERLGPSRLAWFNAEIEKKTKTAVVQQKQKEKPKQEEKPKSANRRSSVSTKTEPPKEVVQEIITPKAVFSTTLKSKIAALSGIGSSVHAKKRKMEALQEEIVRDIKISSDILAQPLKDRAQNKDRLLKLDANLGYLNELEKHIAFIEAQKSIIDDSLELLQRFQEELSLKEISKLKGSSESASVFTVEEFLRWKALVKKEDVNDEAFKTELKVLEEDKWIPLLNAEAAISVRIDQLTDLRGRMAKRKDEHLQFIPCQNGEAQPSGLTQEKIHQIVQQYDQIRFKMVALGIKAKTTFVASPKPSNKPVAWTRRMSLEPRDPLQQPTDMKLHEENTSPVKKRSKAEVAQFSAAQKAVKDAAKAERMDVHKKMKKNKLEILKKLAEGCAVFVNRKKTETEMLHNAFERKKPSEEKTIAERPNVLFRAETMDSFNESQKLKSMINMIKDMKGWKAEYIYAILQSFAYLNDVVYAQHPHDAVKAVAKMLRDKIFHQYAKITRTYTGRNLLDMVNAWIKFLETTDIGLGASPEVVLDKVSSRPLGEIYRLEKTANIDESCDAFEELMQFGQMQSYETGCSIRLVLRKSSKLKAPIQAGHEIVITPKGDTFRVYYKNKNNCKIASFDCDESQRALLSKVMFNGKKLDKDSSPDAKAVYENIYAAVAAKEGCTRFGEDVIGCQAERLYWAITGAERGPLEQAAKEDKHERAQRLLKRFGSFDFREEHLRRGKEARHFSVLDFKVLEEAAETKRVYEWFESSEGANFSELLFARYLPAASSGDSSFSVQEAVPDIQVVANESPKRNSESYRKKSEL